MRRGPALLALPLLVALSGAAAGCDVIDDVFGRGTGDGPDEHVLQAISIETDHPVDPAQPEGAAAATSGELVQLRATGHFVNVDEGDEAIEREITAAVTWVSSNPAIAQPASDGAMLVTGSGTVSIVARTPAAGEVPAIESNEIILSVTTGTGS